MLRLIKSYYRISEIDLIAKPTSYIRDISLEEYVPVIQGYLNHGYLYMTGKANPDEIVQLIKENIVIRFDYVGEWDFN